MLAFFMFLLLTHFVPVQSEYLRLPVVMNSAIFGGDIATNDGFNSVLQQYRYIQIDCDSLQNAFAAKYCSLSVWMTVPIRHIFKMKNNKKSLLSQTSRTMQHVFVCTW